jgi:hypothetical protein
MKSLATCRLCGQESVLRESHIVPGFVIRWLKNSSATGFSRDNNAPNRRRQDGLKTLLLCDDCERRLNKWETEVANKIFHLFNKEHPHRLPYDSWLLKFAVSVSWRSLTYYMDISGGEIQYSRDALELIEDALRVWSDFILDRCGHPGKFEQHIMLLDTIESVSSTSGLPSNLNRFFVRGTHLNMAFSDELPAFIFTKMGRMFLFGFINVTKPRYWEGTKIHVKEGYVGGNIRIPRQVFDYLIECARKHETEYREISPRQKKIISDTLRRNTGRASASETYQTLDCDVRLFGEKFVWKHDDEEA